MQQNMMANAIQSGLLNWSAQTNAPAALEGYAFNKAQQQNRIANRTMGDMAAYWLPLLKNIFEGIFYGSFVFIFLLLFFPFGLAILQAICLFVAVVTAVGPAVRHYQFVCEFLCAAS